MNTPKNVPSTAALKRAAELEFLAVHDTPTPNQGFLLVTNNILAKDAHGNMSHVWMTSMLHGPDKDGFFSAFAHPSNQKIEQIAFWKPLNL
jgi:hypothetical protein